MRTYVPPHKRRPATSAAANKKWSLGWKPSATPPRTKSAGISNWVPSTIASPCDSIDPHFTQLWLDYAITGLGRRNILDERTRFLILIGQFTMTRNADALAEVLRAALHAKVPPRETLEVILQSVVYGGNSVVDFALKIFMSIAREFGVLEALKNECPPLEQNDAKRSMESERKSWHPDDTADPRREKMMTRTIGAG